MRTSASQFEILVDFMETHGDLSKPTDGPQGRITNINLWSQLTSLLNSEGTGDNRTAEKWRKVWSDLKNNTKRKAARCHRDASGTGGGPASKIKLTDLEQRVLNIIGPQAATGIVEVAEIGLDLDDRSPEVEPPVTMHVGNTNELGRDWSQPGTSMQPTQPSTNTSEWIQIESQPSSSMQAPFLRPASGAPPDIPSPTTPAPITPPAAQRATRRRRMFITPHTSPKRSRPSTQAELARMQFLKSDTEWRVLRKEEEKQRMEIEKERLRLREIELKQQARGEELFTQFLSIMSKVVDKYLEK